MTNMYSMIPTKATKPPRISNKDRRKLSSTKAALHRRAVRHDACAAKSKWRKQVEL